MSTTTDLELLELAAKAAGVAYNPELSQPHPTSGAWWGLWLTYDRKPHEFDRRNWNPLKDDGDALRLAMKLGLRVDMNFRPNPASGVGVGVWTPGDIEFYPPFWQIDAKDLARAVRGTIVRAAAELGRAKEAA